MRENGYYWVKYQEQSNWTVARFAKGEDKDYEFSCDIAYYSESDLHEINPQRILTPDEQANLNNGE